MKLLFTAALIFLSGILTKVISEDCNKVYTSLSGTVTSPNFPRNYPSNARCRYVIRNSDYSKRIIINFTHFTLEWNAICMYDSVKIYDGENDNATQIGRARGYCGGSLPPTMTSTGHSISIVFKSDVSQTFSGFSFDYNVVSSGPTTRPPTTTPRPTTKPVCGRTFTEFSGTITSPGFPNRYPNDINCRYLLKYPGLNTVLMATSFQIESGTNCRYDSVKIYDGETTSARLLGSYCRGFPIDGVKSSGDAILVVFKSDDSVTKKGFQISFWRVNGSIPTTVPPMPDLGRCGQPAIQSGRVIAGTDAKRGSWPWQILMLQNGRGMCGGTLVSPNWVVTAAHCISGSEDSPGNFKIRVGEHNTRSTNSAQADMPVRRIIKHPNYRDSAYDYDIALMQLSRPVIINRYVSPACLPAQGQHVPVGTQCFITGWGKIRHPGNMHHTLQQAQIPVVSKQDCAKLNTATSGIAISDRMVCAGHGGATRMSGCHGDSGGPFVCKTGVNGTWVLHGAVSWGSGTCDAAKSYTVFARVASFNSWIMRNIRRYSQSY